MLDKSIPYFNVIMVRKAGIPAPDSPLMEGYSFDTYQEGDEREWGEILASIGEYPADAVSYYRDRYSPHSQELKRRMLFLRTEDGIKAGTFTAWWDFAGGKRVASLHWLGVRPEYQGRGFGKALVSECARRSIQIDGDASIYIHTQTWSYKAIGIYLQAGFKFVRENSFGEYKNEYLKAMPIIGPFLRTTDYRLQTTD